MASIYCTREGQHTDGLHRAHALQRIVALTPDTTLKSRVSPDGFLASSRRKSWSWGKQTLTLNYNMERDFLQALKGLVSIPSVG